MIESGYLGVENYGRARGHVGDSEKDVEKKRKSIRGANAGKEERGEKGTVR